MHIVESKQFCIVVEMVICIKWGKAARRIGERYKVRL